MAEKDIDKMSKQEIQDFVQKQNYKDIAKAFIREPYMEEKDARRAFRAEIDAIASIEDKKMRLLTKILEIKSAREAISSSQSEDLPDSPDDAKIPDSPDDNSEYLQQWTTIKGPYKSFIFHIRGEYHKIQLDQSSLISLTLEPPKVKRAIMYCLNDIAKAYDNIPTGKSKGEKIDLILSNASKGKLPIHPGKSANTVNPIALANLQKGATASKEIAGVWALYLKEKGKRESAIEQFRGGNKYNNFRTWAKGTAVQQLFVDLLKNGSSEIDAYNQANAFAQARAVAVPKPASPKAVSKAVSKDVAVPKPASPKARQVQGNKCDVGECPDGKICDIDQDICVPIDPKKNPSIVSGTKLYGSVEGVNKFKKRYKEILAKKRWDYYGEDDDDGSYVGTMLSNGKQECDLYNPCKDDQYCNMDFNPGRCVTKKIANSAVKSKFTTRTINGVEYIGSKATLDQLEAKLCDEQECGDDGYCDVDYNRCVPNNKNNKKEISFNGKKIIGSDKALKEFEKMVQDKYKDYAEESVFDVNRNVKLPIRQGVVYKDVNGVKIIGTPNAVAKYIKQNKLPSPQPVSDLLEDEEVVEQPVSDVLEDEEEVKQPVSDVLEDDNLLTAKPFTGDDDETPVIRSRIIQANASPKKPSPPPRRSTPPKTARPASVGKGAVQAVQAVIDDLPQPAVIDRANLDKVTAQVIECLGLQSGN